MQSGKPEEINAPTGRTAAGKAAIEAWYRMLGHDRVVTSDKLLSHYEQATFATTQRTPCVLLPETTGEVQACVRIANKYRATLSPISRGFNWGLGSRVPAVTGCAVLDLQRLSRIVDYNDELGYLVVEPGVTFAQAAAFLRERSSQHFLSVIGGPPDASVIGNLTDRGDGLGPTGDRVQHACGFEVVLGSGEVVRTGFGQFPGTQLTHLHQHGLGPSLDGLFSQSNLGVVTKATIWLNRTPANYQAFTCRLRNSQSLSNFIPACRDLIAQRIICPTSALIWNDYKVASVLGQHPEPGNGKFDVNNMLKQLSPRTAGHEWFVGGGLYSATNLMAKAQRRAVRKLTKGLCSGLTFINHSHYRWLNAANRFAERIGMAPIVDPKALEALYGTPALLGYPSDRNLSSLYWRKSALPTRDIDPHRDKCGLYWLCHAVPFTADSVAEVTDVASEVILQHGFEPNLALILKSERCIHLAIQLIWDREAKGADELADTCRQEVESRLNNCGFYPYRLGINSLHGNAVRDGASRTLLGELKRACDPNGVLSPGRYI